MVEIGGVDVIGTSQSQVHSIAALVEDYLSHQPHSIQQHACIHHHLITSILMSHYLHQIIILQPHNKLIQ